MRWLLTILAVLGLGGCALVTGGLPSNLTDEPGALVHRSTATLNHLAASPCGTPLERLLDAAAGVLIVPELTEHDTQWGVPGGVSVLLVRDPASGAFGAPVFYRLRGSGVAEGVEAEAVIVIRDPLLVAELLGSGASFPDAAEISEATGYEEPAEGDPVTCALIDGELAPFDLSGAEADELPRWAELFYGVALTPAEIVAGAGPAGEGARQLRTTLERASRADGRP